MSPIRSFIAIELPPDIRACLARITGRLQAAAADVRWVRPDSVHLTLKFLGSIEEDSVPEIAGCIEQSIRGVTPFAITVRGMGAFPGDRSPQVIWIAAADESGRLAGLQGALDNGLCRLGFQQETRSFSPHLTLGRLRSGRDKEAVRRVLAELKSADCGSYIADAVSLFKSDLRPSGPVYTILKAFSLKPHS